jgi:flotillin
MVDPPILLSVRDVAKIRTVRQAEITRDAQLVEADRDRKRKVIEAEAIRDAKIADGEGQKQFVSLLAEGDLARALKNAEGIAAEGKARGEAETALEMAPVTAQIALNNSIGENKGYQEYLVSIRTVEAGRDIGIEQAKALTKADIKIVATAGSGGPSEGLTSVRDLFTSKGAGALAAAVETFASTEAGERVMNKVLGKSPVSGLKDITVDKGA